MTIALKHYEVINTITRYMLKHDEKGEYLQVKEDDNGHLVVHANANDDVQMFIYHTLKEYNK